MIIITVFHMLTNFIPLKIVEISCKKYCIQGQKREAIPVVIILLYNVYSFVNTGLGMRNIIYTGTLIFFFFKKTYNLLCFE